tara:strand:- start:9072 stop:9980 length:909 start_codon:yes stop_codon:yes gene_type:complete
MAKAFTGWTFGESFSQNFTKAQERQEATRQFEENNSLRYKELGERIEARKFMDEFREKELAERATQFNQNLDQNDDQFNKSFDQKNDQFNKNFDQGNKEFIIKNQNDIIKFNESVNQKELDRAAGVVSQDKTIQERKDQYKEGKTREEREKRSQTGSLVATIPNFEEYSDNSGANIEDGTTYGNEGFLENFLPTPGLFDEGEFNRTSRKYVDSIESNLPTIRNEIKYNPGSPLAKKHIKDLKSISNILTESGEYTGALDSTVFDFFEGALKSNDQQGYGRGEATDAKKTQARIQRILLALEN